MARSNQVKSVIKAMKIFEQLIANRKHMALSDLSKRVNMNISTVHRLVNTLLELGYVKQDENGFYGLGFRSYKLAEIIDSCFDLKKIVHPFLKDIVAQCNETTNLVVLRDYQVVYIDQVESTNMVRMFASMDSRGPAYCTGAGKVLLAYLNQQEIQDYMEQVDFKSFTQNTITTKSELKKELQKVRSQGYAVDKEEKEAGVRCVAAPIFDENEENIAAISVSGPVSRLNEKCLNDLVPLLKKQADKISSCFQRDNLNLGEFK